MDFLLKGLLALFWLVVIPTASGALFFSGKKFSVWILVFIFHIGGADPAVYVLQPAAS